MQEISCNLEIDYSKVEGEPILPFVITLDIDKSVLYPSTGENQRFCYTVTGVGEDSREFKDLSHIVFGICSDITYDELTNVTVYIGEEKQEVTVGEGGNVEILTPDPPTGCNGLKFDFGLDKVSGVMYICYELTKTYNIGANTVCLFGGNATRSGLAICGPICGGDEPPVPCDVCAYTTATLCVPVTVKPYAQTGTPITYCVGETIIHQGENVCGGVKDGCCKFTVTKTVKVKVPILFGADTSVDSVYVTCGEVDGNCSCAPDVVV